MRHLTVLLATLAPAALQAGATATCNGATVAVETAEAGAVPTFGGEPVDLAALPDVAAARWTGIACRAGSDGTLFLLTGETQTGQVHLLIDGSTGAVTLAGPDEAGRVAGSRLDLLGR